MILVMVLAFALFTTEILVHNVDSAMKRHHNVFQNRNIPFVMTELFVTEMTCVMDWEVAICTEEMLVPLHVAVMNFIDNVTTAMTNVE